MATSVANQKSVALVGGRRLSRSDRIKKVIVSNDPSKKLSVKYTWVFLSMFLLGRHEFKQYILQSNTSRQYRDGNTDLISRAGSAAYFSFRTGFRLCHASISLTTMCYPFHTSVKST